MSWIGIRILPQVIDKLKISNFRKVGKKALNFFQKGQHKKTTDAHTKSADFINFDELKTVSSRDKILCIGFVIICTDPDPFIQTKFFPEILVFYSFETYRIYTFFIFLKADVIFLCGILKGVLKKRAGSSGTVRIRGSRSV